MSTEQRARAYVALGANLGEPIRTLRSALDSLASLRESTLVACSSTYRTAPIGVGEEQPDYYNAVAALDTGLSPQQLLAGLFATEAEHGRVRPTHQAARTLDLDLLLFNDLEIEEPGLTVPHPRMHLRAFVLHPLYELAPDLRIPGRGAVRDLLESVADQRISKVPA